MIPIRQPRNKIRRQSGLSLVELLVSMAIAMFLMAGLAAVFGNSARTSNDLNRSLQQIEHGRFAIQALTDQVSLAVKMPPSWVVPWPVGAVHSLTGVEVPPQPARTTPHRSDARCLCIVRQ